MQRRSVLKGLLASSVAASASLPVFAGSNKADVIVIGAGLSGLAAAYNLQQSGMSVIVLEGDNRVGGRVKTLNHVVTQPEAGGMQIGESYGYMRTLAAQLSVPLAPMPPLPRSSAFIVDGHTFTARQWPTHVANKLNAKEKRTPPSALLFQYLKQMPRIGAAENWNNPEFAHLDIAMDDYLRSLGASEQAIELMDANLNANSLSELSAAEAVHVLTQRMTGGRKTDKAVGGNSKFIEALAAKVNTIKLNKKVVKISNSGGITVVCDDGSQYQAKQCICTVPYSVLRSIDINAPTTEPVKQAINQLNYTAITQVHFEITDDSFLQDGLPANMWSNEQIGRVFVSKDKSGNNKHLVCWLNGTDAMALDKLAPAQAMLACQQFLVKHRPSMKGKIKPMDLVSWGNNPFSKGAYASFAPGQVQGFSASLAESAGNLHFAGEHTEHRYSGMESALVSGLNAVAKVQASI